MGDLSNSAAGLLNEGILFWMFLVLGMCVISIILLDREG